MAKSQLNCVNKKQTLVARVREAYSDALDTGMGTGDAIRAVSFKLDIPTQSVIAALCEGKTQKRRVRK